MEFSLDAFLERHPPTEAPTNLDAVFGDPARTGTLMEMPCNLPDAIVTDLKAHLDRMDFNRYPVDGIAELRAQIVAWMNMPASHSVLFGNGAFQIIDLVMQYLGSGARALTLDPDFFMYRLAARKYGIDLGTHSLSSDFSIDLAELRRHVAADPPDLIVLSNSHNPTSTWFPPEVIEAILTAAPGLVLIDEVYAPFAPQPSACAAQMHRYPNLLVLRSFSKVGAAAIRFGFLAGHERVLERISAWQTTFAVSGVTLRIAASMIRNYPLIEENVQGVIDERDRMVRRLERLPDVTVFPSSTNFVVVRMASHDVFSVCQSLVAQSVRVIPYQGSAALKNCLRLSVDTPANNGAAVERLRAVLAS